MRTHEAGSASVWMLMVVLLLAVTAMGVARIGGSGGDYVRRQITADAAASSAADVLHERLNHIGRLQEIGRKALEVGDNDAARRAAEAAKLIAQGTPNAVRSAAQDIARGNNARSCDVTGMPGSGTLPNAWFELMSAEDPEIEWVGLASDFRHHLIRVAIRQPTPTGPDRRASAVVRLKPEGEWPSGPLLEDNWRAARVLEAP